MNISNPNIYQEIFFSESYRQNSQVIYGCYGYKVKVSKEIYGHNQLSVYTASFLMAASFWCYLLLGDHDSRSSWLIKVKVTHSPREDLSRLKMKMMSVTARTY